MHAGRRARAPAAQRRRVPRRVLLLAAPCRAYRGFPAPIAALPPCRGPMGRRGGAQRRLTAPGCRTLKAMVRVASAMDIISWRSLGSGVASTRNSARLSPICESETRRQRESAGGPRASGVAEAARYGPHLGLGHDRVAAGCGTRAAQGRLGKSGLGAREGAGLGGGHHLHGLRGRGPHEALRVGGQWRAERAAGGGDRGRQRARAALRSRRRTLGWAAPAMEAETREAMAAIVMSWCVRGQRWGARGARGALPGAGRARMGSRAGGYAGDTRRRPCARPPATSPLAPLAPDVTAS